MRDRGAITGLSITVTDPEGPDHQRTFTATATATGGGGEVAAEGRGPSKTTARTAAAEALLRALTPRP